MFKNSISESLLELLGNFNKKRSLVWPLFILLWQTDFAASFVCENATKNHDEIHKHANSKKPTSQKPQNSCSNFSNHKAMYAQHSKEEAHDCQKPTCLRQTFSAIKSSFYKKVLIIVFARIKLLFFFICDNTKQILLF